MDKAGITLRAILARTGRAGVLFIDGILVRRYGVEVFADDPECILRASLSYLDHQQKLADGTILHARDKLVELHFWNEHLPTIGEEGPDLLWGRQFHLRLVHSLHLLAVWVQSEPRYEGFAAAHGQLGFLPGTEERWMQRLPGRFGFMLEVGEAPGWRFWKGDFWAGLYSWWLMWVFNPNTLKHKHMPNMARSDLWMTRGTLLERYGPQAGQPGQ
jgi:YkoP domain